VLEEAWNLLSDDAQIIFRSAESNLDALNTVDLGPKRPFSVGECALWARLTGPQFAAQVAAVVSLVEAPTTARLLRWPRRLWPSNMATRRAIRSKSSSSRLSPANTPKLIQKGTKAAAAEAAEVAAETEAAAQQEQTERL
jgi:hypothetical protein